MISGVVASFLTVIVISGALKYRQRRVVYLFIRVRFPVSNCISFKLPHVAWLLAEKMAKLDE